MNAMLCVCVCVLVYMPAFVCDVSANWIVILYEYGSTDYIFGLEQQIPWTMKIP